MTANYSEKNLTRPISNHKYILVGLAFLVFAVYINGFGNSFVSDDIAWFVKNPQLGNWGWLLKFPDRVGMWLVYFLAYSVGGLQPITFRLVNVFFHLGSTLLIYLLMQVLFTDRKLSIITAVLFAVHPILVESVTWIAGGSHAMYAFWFLLSFLLYVWASKQKTASSGGYDKKLYPLSLASFTLAPLFSEKAVSLAAIFLLYEIIFGSVRKNWLRLLPYFGISALFIFIQLTKVGTRVAGLATYNYLQPGYYNPLIQWPVAISEYLRLILWPAGLTLYHSELNFNQGQFLLRVGVFIGFFGLISFAAYRSYRSYKTYTYLFFWLSFFVITLLPVLTPLRVAWVVAERYVYLGTLGILAAMALAIKKLSQIQNLQTIVYVLFVLYVLSLGWRTVQRNREWKNEDSLWIATAKTSPSSPNTHNNLGDVYGRHGQLELAVAEFKRAIEIKPDYADAYHNLGNTYQQLARRNQSPDYLQKAIQSYQRAAKLNPNLWQSLQNLGAIYFYQKDYKKAAQYFEKAIQINPKNQSLQQNLEVIKQKLSQSP